MFFVKRHKFKAGFIVIGEDLAFGCFYTFSDFEEELINIVFVLFSGFFIEWISDFVFFDINENESNGLDNGEYEMLRAIIPLFLDLCTKIKKPSIKINHRMPYFTHKVYFRRPSGEIIKCNLELILGIFEEAIPDKDNTMPNWIKRNVL